MLSLYQRPVDSSPTEVPQLHMESHLNLCDEHYQGVSTRFSSREKNPSNRVTQKISQVVLNYLELNSCI